METTAGALISNAQLFLHNHAQIWGCLEEPAAPCFLYMPGFSIPHLFWLAEFLKGIISQVGMVKYRSSPGLDARLQVIILKILKSRFPNRREILPVFAVFLFFGFSWALYRMFWYVPSWLEYLNIWKVLTISAYVMAFGLAESIFMTGGLVLFSLFFPDRVFKKHYILLGQQPGGFDKHRRDPAAAKNQPGVQAGAVADDSLSDCRVSRACHALCWFYPGSTNGFLS